MWFEFMCAALGAFMIYGSTTKRNKPKQINKYATRTDTTIKEIRFQGRFYDVTNFVDRHPGGKIIEFYVNNDEDASTAIQQFHHRSAKKVQAILKSFKSRPVPEEEKEIVKANDVANDGENGKPRINYAELTKDFCQLFKDLQDEGMFEPSLIYVAIRITELVTLASLGMFLVIKVPGVIATAAGLLILNLFQMRSQFFVHEGGHHSLTGVPSLDRLMESIAFGVSSGLSGSWWRVQHNKHHAMPQRLQHDVDLSTLPLIAYNKRIAENEDNYMFNVFLKYQAKLLVPVTSGLGRIAWQLHLHPTYIFKRAQYQEFLFLALHYYAAYHLGLDKYLILLFLNSPSMLVTFSISHSHLPVTDEPRHWVEYSTYHTMNVDPSWWCDYWMGYLNYQIEHHLLPTLPQFRLRSISGRVRALVEKHGLPYICMSYSEAMTKMFVNLADVAHELEKDAVMVEGKKNVRIL